MKLLLFNLDQQLKYWRLDGLKCCRLLKILRKGIYNYIFTTLSIYNLIVISQKFWYPYFLLRSWDTLFQEIFQTMVICCNDKISTNEIWSPMLNNMNNNDHFLFIGGFSQIFTWEALLMKAKGHHSFISTTPIPNRKESI